MFRHTSRCNSVGEKFSAVFSGGNRKSGPFFAIAIGEYPTSPSKFRPGLCKISDGLNLIVFSELKNDAGISLRILSDTKPDKNAVNVSPSLEDYYLSVFGDLIADK